MRKYAALVNQAAGSVNIRQYDDADNTTFEGMWGPYENVMFESTRKADCVDFIRKNYPRIHMYVVIVHMAEGYAYIRDYNTWSGTTYQDLEVGHGSIMFESTRKADCINYMKNKCAHMNCDLR